MKRIIEKFQRQQAAADIEAAINNDSSSSSSPPQQGRGSRIEWVVALCLGFAAQPIETTTWSSKVYVESGLLLIMCSFSCLFMSKYKCFDSTTRGVMQQLGLFSGVTAFFIRTTCQSSVWLKCVGWTVYTLTWLAIFVFTTIYTSVAVSPSPPSPQTSLVKSVI